LRGKRHAGDAFVVVDGGRDHSRDEGAVAFLVGVGSASDPAPGQPDPGAELRVTAVDARVDDRHADRVHDRKLCRKGVESVVLSQVVLLRHEGVARDEADAKGHPSGGRRQGQRQDRKGGCPHGVETWSTGEKPTTKPWPEFTRARYTPVVSCSFTRKSPFASTVAWPTVGQVVPCCFWIRTVVPASDAGRTYAAQLALCPRRIEAGERRNGNTH